MATKRLTLGRFSAMDCDMLAAEDLVVSWLGLGVCCCARVL